MCVIFHLTRLPDIKLLDIYIVRVSLGVYVRFTTSKYGKAAAGSQNDSAGTSAETVLLFSEVLPAALIGLAARDHLRSQAGSVSEAGSDASFSKTTLVSFKIPVALGAQVMNPVSSLSWLSVWETAWSQAPSNTSNEYEETLRQCELKVVEAKITTTPGANEDLSAVASRRRSAQQRARLAKQLVGFI